MKGQILLRPLTGPFTGTAAYSNHSVDLYSLLTNTAALARLKNSAACVLAERRFMVKELNSYRAALGLRTHSGNFALELGYAGFTGYKESKLGLAHGRQLGSKIGVGVQFNLQGIMIPGYGKTSTLGFAAGVMLQLTGKLNAGFHVDNPIPLTFGPASKDHFPSLYTIGFGFEPSSKVLFVVEFIKEEGTLVNVNTGMQYQVHPKCRIRAGISTSTTSIWAGLGLSLHKCRVDIVSSFHPQLGTSTGLLLLFEFATNAS